MLATGIIAHITAPGGQIRGIHPQKITPNFIRGDFAFIKFFPTCPKGYQMNL